MRNEEVRVALLAWGYPSLSLTGNEERQVKEILEY